MSRAVVTCSSLGRPEALRNTVDIMPMAWAFLVIIRAKLPSVPARFSATVTATSLAESVTRALMASLVRMVDPGFRLSLVGDWLAA